MGRFTLKQIDAFLAVARNRSFASAANELCISQPSVSARIKELESALQIRLFDRDQRTVNLTAEGQRLFGLTVKLAAASDEISQVFTTSSRSKQIYRIGFTDGFFLNVVKAFTAKMKATMPGVEIVSTVGDGDQINHLLLRRKIDIGILPDAVVDDQISRQLLCVNELGWYAKRDHPVFEIAQNPGILCSHELMIYSFPSRMNKKANEWFLLHEINPKYISISGSLYNIFASVMRGNCIGLLPKKFVENEDIDQVCRCILLPEPQLNLDMFVCYQRNLPNESVRGIVDIIRKSAMELDYDMAV
jgi:DNA-binding transcriptional LysR family regulator